MEVNLNIAPENGRTLCGHWSRSFEGLLLFLLDDNELLLVKTSLISRMLPRQTVVSISLEPWPGMASYHLSCF